VRTAALGWLGMSTRCESPANAHAGEKFGAIVELACSLRMGATLGWSPTYCHYSRWTQRKIEQCVD